jgi:hypothetical protein
MFDSTEDLEMAHHSLGYGHWDAPYWFIGPEQGKGRKESPDNTPRVEAWKRLGKPEVYDCREFHSLIANDDWQEQGRNSSQLGGR